MGGKVGENQAALRAAVFSLLSKNLSGAGGGGVRSNAPPPPAGRGLNRTAAPVLTVIGVGQNSNWIDDLG